MACSTSPQTPLFWVYLTIDETSELRLTAEDSAHECGTCMIEDIAILPSCLMADVSCSTPAKSVYWACTGAKKALVGSALSHIIGSDHAEQCISEVFKIDANLDAIVSPCCMVLQGAASLHLLLRRSTYVQSTYGPMTDSGAFGRSVEAMLQIFRWSVQTPHSTSRPLPVVGSSRRMLP